jgi:hypothetical protein
MEGGTNEVGKSNEILPSRSEPPCSFKRKKSSAAGDRQNTIQKNKYRSPRAIASDIREQRQVAHDDLKLLPVNPETSRVQRIDETGKIMDTFLSISAAAKYLGKRSLSCLAFVLSLSLSLPYLWHVFVFSL